MVCLFNYARSSPFIDGEELVLKVWEDYGVTGHSADADILLKGVAKLLDCSAKKLVLTVSAADFKRESWSRLKTGAQQNEEVFVICGKNRRGRVWEICVSVRFDTENGKPQRGEAFELLVGLLRDLDVWLHPEIRAELEKSFRQKGAAKRETLFGLLVPEV